MKFLAIASLASLVLGAAAVPGPIPVRGNISDVHDPTICKDNNGKYFLFSSDRGTLGIPIRTSTNREDWVFEGVMWPDGASWADPFTGGQRAALWAPDCQYVDGEFRVFYSASTTGSQNSAIFYATSSTGAPGSFTHRGLVVRTFQDDSNYNAIDPNLYIASNGSWFMSVGSFWTGIKLASLNTDGTLASQTLTALAERTHEVAGQTDAIEGSSLYSTDGWFYLFTSWDHCCVGVDSNYNIRVGRARDITGPYVDQEGTRLLDAGGTQILATHDDIHGPGGQAVFNDDDGPILVYHYYLPEGSFLGLNRLDFSSGWPVVV